MASNHHKSKLVEEQINKLMVAQSRDFEKDSKHSPMVDKLLQNEKHVQKLKQIFEEKECGKEEATAAADEKLRKKMISPQQRVLNRARKSFDCIRKIATSPTSPKYMVNRLEKLVRELVQKERDYIDTLERGIENYLKPIAMTSYDKCDVPEEIRNQKFKLFTNVEEICLLHKSTVLPYLLSCGDNIHQIAETFINLIQSEAFYCYINYAINHKQAQELVSSHAQFFVRLQRIHDDRLGVMSFIIQPVQKIPRYPLILEEMIKELSKDMHANKQALASLCIAKKNFERFLKRLNQAMTVNDIVETQQIPANLQCGLITCLQIEFGISINEPTLLLIPPFSSHHGYRHTINIFSLGKFIRTQFVSVHEHYTARIFQSKIFIFEKCLLYTKVVMNEKTSSLAYRDHYMFGTHFSMQLKNSEEMLMVGDTITNRYVSFQSDDFEDILELYECLKGFHNPRYSQDSAFVEMENHSEDENFVNEGMADWVVTEMDQIKATSGDDDENENDANAADLWPAQVLKSFGMRKNKKKKASKSRFYVTAPTDEDDNDDVNDSKLLL